MDGFKHSKHKNIAIIFELLSRQVVNDILCNKKTNAINIIKRNFNKNSEISKELILYKSISEFNRKVPNVASKFLDIVIEQRNQLDVEKLRKEKYKLLGEIKASFKDTEFFNSRVNNYKLLASIYQLFENAPSKTKNPQSYIKCYSIIIETITSTASVITEESESMKVWEKQPKEIKQLAFGLVIENFNEKYKSLSVRQKTLISKFINENPDSPEFKNYILDECLKIKKVITTLTEGVSEPTTKIKLKEVCNLLNEIITAKFIKEEHLSALLNYYELIKTLKK